jgi:signal transduction histidine kinase
MTRRWVTRAGLRWKLLLALVATAAITLAVAMLTIVQPLQQRLESDQLKDLIQLARTTRVAVAALPPDQLYAGSHRLDQMQRSIERRTGAHIAIYGRNGEPLVDPDSRSLRDADSTLLRRHGGLLEGIVDNVAVVAVRQAGPRNGLTIVLRKPLRDQRAAAAVVRSGLPVAAGVGLLVAVLLAAGLSYRLLRRLERLRQSARHLARGGIEDPLPPDPARDEVGDLARALEAMRVWLNEEERSRQAFLSTASHELRTPIASLQGTLELLGEDLADSSDEHARRRAANALRQSQRLAQLAGDLLDLSRVDGGVELRREPVDLHDVALAIAAEAEDAAETAGVRIEVPDAAGGAWAAADPMAVARIVRLLLDNALRYGAAGGEVTIIAAGGAHGRATLRVQDRGPGIPPEERERIFGRFERGAAGAERPGFGLGLPIGRGLARLMGGDLRAPASTDGACLELVLPACDSPAAEAPPPDAAPLTAGS